MRVDVAYLSGPGCQSLEETPHRVPPRVTFITLPNNLVSEFAPVTIPLWIRNEDTHTMAENSGNCFYGSMRECRNCFPSASAEYTTGLTTARSGVPEDTTILRQNRECVTDVATDLSN